MRNANRSLSAVFLAAFAIAALCFLLWRGDETDRTSGGATTESAAAAAGAKVLPTDPKLKVEPR